MFGRHMTDAEIVIPLFGHYVNLASTLGALPGVFGVNTPLGDGLEMSSS